MLRQLQREFHGSKLAAGNFYWNNYNLLCSPKLDNEEKEASFNLEIFYKKLNLKMKYLNKWPHHPTKYRRSLVIFNNASYRHRHNNISIEIDLLIMQTNALKYWKYFLVNTTDWNGFFYKSFLYNLVFKVDMFIFVLFSQTQTLDKIWLWREKA